MTDEKKDKEEVIIAVALPPHTGQPLGGFLYQGVLPSKDFIRENGATTEYSNGEGDSNERTGSTEREESNGGR